MVDENLIHKNHHEEVLKIQNKLTGSMITQAGFGKGDTRIQSGPTTRITFNTRDLSSLGINTDTFPVFHEAITAENVEEKTTVDFLDR